MKFVNWPREKKSRNLSIARSKKKQLWNSLIDCREKNLKIRLSVAENKISNFFNWAWGKHRDICQFVSRWNRKYRQSITKNNAKFDNRSRGKHHKIYQSIAGGNNCKFSHSVPRKYREISQSVVWKKKKMENLLIGCVKKIGKFVQRLHKKKKTLRVLPVIFWEKRAFIYLFIKFSPGSLCVLESTLKIFMKIINRLNQCHYLNLY